MVLFLRRPVKGGRGRKVCGGGPLHPQASARRRVAPAGRMVGGVAREGEGEAFLSVGGAEW